MIKAFIYTYLLCAIVSTEETRQLYIMEGECPTDVKIGGVWHENCTECHCKQPEYECYSCEPIKIPPECTPTYHLKDPYPDCCMPELECPERSNG